MNPAIVKAKQDFWALYQHSLLGLAGRPRRELIDLQHEAEELTRLMSLPFSDRAAAQIILAATTQLLG